MSKTIKTNKQFEQEKQKGKITYRKRVLENEEAEEMIREVKHVSPYKYKLIEEGKV